MGIITITLAIPVLGALLLGLYEGDDRTSKIIALTASLATFVASIVLLVQFQVSDANL